MCLLKYTCISINVKILKTLFPHLHIGYEPAGLTVHPPRIIEGGFIFLAWVCSATKIFPQKKVKAYKTCFYVFLLKCNFYQLPIT